MLILIETIFVATLVNIYSSSPGFLLSLYAAFSLAFAQQLTDNLITTHITPKIFSKLYILFILQGAN